MKIRKNAGMALMQLTNGIEELGCRFQIKNRLKQILSLGIKIVAFE